MSQPYQALYRSWRPQRFDGVVGQEHVIRTLANALRTGRVAHAYLFAGPRGTGKTSVAKLLAKAVNCQSPEGVEPCNRCDLCREINDGSTMDVLEIDAASNRGIDEIRELRERVRYAPARGRYKVYIIDEVHMLTTEAFNALLKTLEEPPAHALFILATTEPHRLPATIISRCQRFDFHRLSPEQIVQRLEAVCTAMGVEAEPEALRLLARLAEGGLRDALSLLDQCLAMGGDRLEVAVVAELLGLAPGEGILALTRAVVEGDMGAGLRAVADLAAQGVDLAQALRDWVACWRDLLALRSGLDSRNLLYAGEDLAARLEPLARGLDDATALACFDALAEGEALLRWSGQPRLALEAALIRAVGERLARAPGGAAGTAAPAAGVEPAGAAWGGRPGDGGPGRGAGAMVPATAPAAGPERPEPEESGPEGLATRTPAQQRSRPTGGSGHTSAAAGPAPAGPEPAAEGGAAPGQAAAAPPQALAQQWERFLQSLRRRREWTALHALLRAAGAPRVAGAELEIPFAQPGMARTAEVKLPQLRRAIEAFLGAPVPVRVTVGNGGPPSGPGASPAQAQEADGPAAAPAAGRAREPEGRADGAAPEVAGAQEPPTTPVDPGMQVPFGPAAPQGAHARQTPDLQERDAPPATGGDGAAQERERGAAPPRGSGNTPGAGTASRPAPGPAQGQPAERGAPGNSSGRAAARCHPPLGQGGTDAQPPRAQPATPPDPPPAPAATAPVPGSSGESLPPDLDAVQRAAWELFGGQWIPVKEEWQRELRPHGQDAETA
ncbi:DNA polymerase III subunit gamma/tau [Thermaerobacter sp. PB12/4term]|uniref:DNA polymerase III subunit gamma/tau n=1 Tax=Thermaerobacter sp. PB12/4term TaxID=2293838 RepID=UPI000E3264C3|nr:DNA polymerase III subunit gamma/tau [Thermaerobacter sp. PB12/4term]QIA26148.1 DNA polymerase III subunit gamma/tau [Thermaerobacter sp. PB12/4term]